MGNPHPGGGRTRPGPWLAATTATLALAGYLSWALGQGLGDFGSFTVAWHLLRSPSGGLHLYARHTETHMGPLTLVLGSLPLRFAPLAPQVLDLTAGVAAIAVLTATARVSDSAARWSRGVMAVGLGAVLIDAGVFWVHPDVVAVCLAAAAATWAARGHRRVGTGLALGIGFGCSAAAILFAPLLLVLPAGRDRRRASLWAVGAGALPWLPFVAADPATVLHLGGADLTAPDSIWGVLGYRPATPSVLLRAVQVGIILIAALVVLRRRDAGTAVVVIGALRVGLDPATWSYLLVLLVTAGIAADVLRRGPVRPIATLGCLLVAALPLEAGSEWGLRCVLRLVAVAVLLLAALFPRQVLQGWARLHHRDPVPTAATA